MSLEGPSSLLLEVCLSYHGQTVAVNDLDLCLSFYYSLLGAQSDRPYNIVLLSKIRTYVFLSQRVVIRQGGRETLSQTQKLTKCGPH